MTVLATEVKTLRNDLRFPALVNAEQGPGWLVAGEDGVG